jgi:hypothetical protein
MPESVENLANATRLATGLINNVFLIPGVVAKAPSLADGDARYEFTPFAVLKMPHATEPVLLIRSATNMQWQKIQFSQVDFDKPSKWVISKTDLGINDITSGFNSNNVTVPNDADWQGHGSSSIRHLPSWIFMIFFSMIH